MGLLLQTPKVLSLLFDRKTMPSCPDFIPMLNSTINLIAGSAECSPSSSIEGFSWWVSLLQKRTFFNSANLMMSNNPKMDWYNILYLNYGNNVTFNYVSIWFNDYFVHIRR